MSSAVIPDENATGEYDEFADNSIPSSDPNAEPDFLEKDEPQGSTSALAQANASITDPEQRARYGLPPLDNGAASPNTISSGRKRLRTAVFKGADLTQRRNAIVGQIAKSKYSEYSQPRALKMALNDYNLMVNKTAIRLQRQQPGLDMAQIQLLAEQEVLSASNTAKVLVGSAISGATSKGKKLAVKGAKKAVKYVGNAIFVGLGTVLSWLLFTKKGRIIIVLLCMCCFFLFYEVYQTFASEDKWNSISKSANLVFCAGGTDQQKLAKCLFDQKLKEYALQEPTPE